MGTPVLYKGKKKSDRTTMIVLYVLAGIVLLALLYTRVIKPWMDKQAAAPTGSTTDGSGSQTKLPVNPKNTRLGNTATLKKGTKGQEVQWVQYYYNKYYIPKFGGAKLAEDAIFGTKTEAAVKRVTGYITTNWNNFKYAVDKAKSGGSTASSSNLLSAIVAAGPNGSAFNDGWSPAPAMNNPPNGQPLYYQDQQGFDSWNFGG